MGVISLFPSLTKILYTGSLPPIGFNLGEGLNHESIKLVLEDYKRLEEESLSRNKKGRANWCRKINEKDIAHWSKHPYWRILDSVQARNSLDNPAVEVSDEFLKFYGKDQSDLQVYRWMVHNFDRSRVSSVLPGFLSEYIRRFEAQDHVNNGYDKMLHYLWGVVLPDRVGFKSALTISFLAEILDSTIVGYQEAKGDFDAFLRGIEKRKQLENGPEGIPEAS